MGVLAACKPRKEGLIPPAAAGADYAKQIVTCYPIHPRLLETARDRLGARVACYSLVGSGLRNAERLHRAAINLQHADGTEAAWWFGLMENGRQRRVVRALRILVDAVK